MTNSDFKSGFISVIGRPNVGKSTLVNAIVGEKVAAVSNKPNTTRNRISGILTHSNSQLIFLDTPGIHKAKGKLHKSMVQTSMNAIEESDVIVMVVDVNQPFLKGDKFIIENLPKPSILVINKIDRIKKSEILEIMDQSRQFKDKFTDAIPVSAKNAEGIVELVETIKKYLPDGEKYFPDDMYTDQPERFLVGELIREKIFNLTKDEIPYKTAVFVEEFKENSEKKIVRIAATVFVERKSHKGIVIGKNGMMLKEIGSQARVDIERILGSKVFIELWVKVKERWSENNSIIKELGYLI